VKGEQLFDQPDVAALGLHPEEALAPFLANEVLHAIDDESCRGRLFKGLGDWAIWGRSQATRHHEAVTKTIQG